MENTQELGNGLPWAASTETLLQTVEKALNQLKTTANSANKGSQPINDFDAYVERVKAETTIIEKGWLEAGHRAGLLDQPKGIALVLFWNLPGDIRAGFIKRFVSALT